MFEKVRITGWEDKVGGYDYDLVETYTTGESKNIEDYNIHLKVQATSGWIAKPQKIDVSRDVTAHTLEYAMTLAEVNEIDFPTMLKNIQVSKVAHRIVEAQERIKEKSKELEERHRNRQELYEDA